MAHNDMLAIMPSKLYKLPPYNHRDCDLQIPISAYKQITFFSRRMMTVSNGILVLPHSHLRGQDASWMRLRTWNPLSSCFAWTE